VGLRRDRWQVSSFHDLARKLATQRSSLLSQAIGLE
jgi:hypothetical protein